MSLTSWSTESIRTIMKWIIFHLIRQWKMIFIFFWGIGRICGVFACSGLQVQCFSVFGYICRFCFVFMWLSLWFKYCSFGQIWCVGYCSWPDSQDFIQFWGRRGFNRIGQWFGCKGQLRLNQVTRGWAFVFPCFFFDFSRINQGLP